ncbi:unnamed protein product [Penicillium egyptiacum]|uniref:FAD-binding PCMH-type domain-containing protein n=1 Tax=Penicillium egyptiacum TaxID=1303716 RepID=A0A9W4KJI8_9EURO|nr:unnamed protein product [Penicillium egyptiacum]
MGCIEPFHRGSSDQTAPVASSCYPGNPFDSPEKCTSVQDKWSYAALHAAWPESIDFPIYTNNSCVPKGATGYVGGKGCSIGGLPQYIVNATTVEHVSTGAFALSIWTRNFKHIERRHAWQWPGRNETDDVVVCGSGNNWGSVYTAVHRMRRTVVGGEDATVGLGGLIQNGGHGFLSSHHGLASDQVYQVTVVTTDGRCLVANSVENKGLFWAVRGGGGGQYGVVMEFILKTHPVPANVVMGGFSFYAADSSNTSETASWNALSEVVSSIPDLMDGGLNGNITAYTKTRSMALGLKEAPPGVAAVIGFVGLNMTIDQLLVFCKPEPLSSNSAGAVSLMTSRLMGRRELSDIARNDLTEYLQQALVSENPEAGTMLLFGLQGGRGPAHVPTHMRGSVLSAWRTAYAHVFTLGASINTTSDASESLSAAADHINFMKALFPFHSFAQTLTIYKIYQ